MEQADNDDVIFEGYSTFEVLVELIDTDLARRLCKAVGGKKMYIPASADKAGWLVDIVGYEAAEAICKYYRISDDRGDWLLVPMGRGDSYNLADVAKLMDDNVSLRESATALGIHARTVSRARQSINRMRARRLKGRINAFRSEGYSASRIAAELNIAELSVKAIIEILDAEKRTEVESGRANRRAIR